MDAASRDELARVPFDEFRFVAWNCWLLRANPDVFFKPDCWHCRGPLSPASHDCYHPSIVHASGPSSFNPGVEPSDYGLAGDCAGVIFGID